MKLIEVYRRLAKIYMEITWKEPGGLLLLAIRFQERQLIA